MTKFFISVLFCFTNTFAINPPKDGKFPDGFWKKMEEQNIGKAYGDPGWVKKLSNYKNNSNRDEIYENFNS